MNVSNEKQIRLVTHSVKVFVCSLGWEVSAKIWNKLLREDGRFKRSQLFWHLNFYCWINNKKMKVKRTMAEYNQIKPIALKIHTCYIFQINNLKMVIWTLNWPSSTNDLISACVHWYKSMMIIYWMISFHWNVQSKFLSCTIP